MGFPRRSTYHKPSIETFPPGSLDSIMIGPLVYVLRSFPAIPLLSSASDTSAPDSTSSQGVAQDEFLVREESIFGVLVVGSGSEFGRGRIRREAVGLSDSHGDTVDGLIEIGGR